MQRILVVLLVLLAAACQKEKILVEPTQDEAVDGQKAGLNPERMGRETVRFHVSKRKGEIDLDDLDWDKFSIVRKSAKMIAVKIPLNSCDAVNYKFLIVNVENGKLTSIFRNEIKYKVENGKRTLPEFLRNYNYQTKKWVEYDLRSKSKAKDDKDGKSSGIDKKSLVSPGGTLPMVTIVGTYSNGSTTTFSSSTSYVLATMLGISGSSGSGSGTGGGGADGGIVDNGNYTYLDYLDPLYTNNDGGGSLQTEVIEWEMDESPQQTAIDLDEYLKCFDNVPDAGSNFSIKVMVDIPVDANPNSLINVGATGLSVGHVFISITKTNGSQSVNQVIGFYPSSDYKSVTLSPVTSKLADDGKSGQTHEYNASLTLDGWNAAEFKAFLNQLRYNSTMRYEIDAFNCANFVGSSLNAVRPGTLSSVATTGVNPLNPTELINIPWSPNGVYKSLVDLKATNSALAPKIETNVIKQGSTSKGACF
ncbi:hypothetical protein [Phnomibacter ginsenosidimutans]|uniref:Uncharacterized protein n=1 Tax=Phnomibacter ginsenosidimutans TaxID=2676868 RepID=A0A6I6GMS9_9BACT|nr:hypothetical protein [Phnomibacter ginsenosidimutans]QGW29835.1 hypothetical protein GLV81_18450 [Phnomibacter ginsenosidimutans]